MSQQTIDDVDPSPRRSNNETAADRVLIGLAMLSGAGFLYLLMLFDIVPVAAIDGHAVTIFLALMGVGTAVYGWLRILTGRTAS